MTGGSRFAVRLTPRGSADRVEGVRDGALQVRVRAAPVAGAANAALLRLLAAELEVPLASVGIAGRGRGRLKTVRVAGLTDAQLVARWPGLRLGGPRSVRPRPGATLR